MGVAGAVIPEQMVANTLKNNNRQKDKKKFSQDPGGGISKLRDED